MFSALLFLSVSLPLEEADLSREAVGINFLLLPFYDTLTGKHIGKKRQYWREGTELNGPNT
jgi:hypothetical protein